MVRVNVRNTPARWGSDPEVMLLRGRLHFQYLLMYVDVITHTLPKPGGLFGYRLDAIEL
jgi:hypothetical protein